MSQSFTYGFTHLPPPAPGKVCPRCERRVPIPKEDTTPRKREQLNLSVPADHENGREILVTLIEETRKKLGRPVGTPPYIILVEGLHELLTA